MTARACGLHELGLAEAVRAIREGEFSSELYLSALLKRARDRADLNAFITIHEPSVLEAARDADRRRRAGFEAPLLGVPLAIKDSYLTRGLRTTVGTSALATFTPARDAAAVAAMKDLGAIVFGKNNLVEMSYGLTGFNDHYGQVKNPYNTAHITGGSSSGAGASVAACIIPAAFAGDTVGSIRVPASLCGVVGYKPTTGRWRSDGVMPISTILDSIGLVARSVEDCELVDALLTGDTAFNPRDSGDLRGCRFAYAPRQHLAGIDEHVDRAFREALRQFEDAGAELIEVDLGADFFPLANRITWPIFFHDTTPAIRDFLATNGVPVSFEELFAAAGDHVRETWARAVVPSGPGFISDQTYLAATSARDELRRRLESNGFERADALVFPTTPCPAPRIEDQWRFRITGPAMSEDVTDTFLSRNTHPSNAAGVAAISIPMGLSSEGLPVGLELDAAGGRDRDLLALARRVERVLGPMPGPATSGKE